jgi:hypothetical protein
MFLCLQSEAADEEMNSLFGVIHEVLSMELKSLPLLPHFAFADGVFTWS